MPGIRCCDRIGAAGAAVPIVTIVLAVLVALAVAAVVVMYIKKFRGGGGGGGARGAARPGMAAAGQAPALDPRDAFENPLYDIDIEVEPRDPGQREVSAAGGALGNSGYAEVAPFCPAESVSEGAGYEFEPNGMMRRMVTEIDLDVVPAGAGSGWVTILTPIVDIVMSYSPAQRLPFSYVLVRCIDILCSWELFLFVPFHFFRSLIVRLHSDCRILVHWGTPMPRQTVNRHQVHGRPSDERRGGERRW